MMRLASAHRLFLALLAIGLVAACASGPKRPDPTPLETVSPKIAGKQVWSQSLGSIGFPMRPVALPGSVTVATYGGTVLALSPDTGRELWRGEAGGRITAGVGSDGRYAGVVTTDNELVVLDAGKPLWRARLGTRVVTPPLVAGERVFVLGVDRSVQAFDVLDGRKLWVQQRPGDPLTLLQPGVLLPWKDTLVAGQGPRLAGFDPLRGVLRWETTVASPRGTNEIERLADLVGPAVRVAESVCVRGFQAAVGCVNAENGSLAWTRTLSGAAGVAADEQFVFAADANDRITAWKRSTGEVAWASDRLLFRRLSSPMAVSRTLVVGDLEGQVHFLDRENGQTLLRLPTDGSALVGAPLSVGNTIIAVTERGGVFAFRPE